MNKLLIAGSRDITYKRRVFEIINSKFLLLSKLIDLETCKVISGTAAGIDRLGEEWAIAREFEVIYMPADWNTYGKSAGVYRNAKMAKAADAAIIIWDGISKGTRNMIETFQREEKPMFVHLY